MNGTAGSVGIAGWIAQVAFWVLVTFGIAHGDLSRRAAAVFVSLWLVGYLGIPHVGWWAASLVMSWVAVLDIALVFIVFKGDVSV